MFVTKLVHFSKNSLGNFHHLYCFENAMAANYHGRSNMPNMQFAIVRVIAKKSKCDVLDTTVLDADTFESNIGISGENFY